MKNLTKKETIMLNEALFCVLNAYKLLNKLKPFVVKKQNKKPKDMEYGIKKEKNYDCRKRCK